MPQKVGAQKLVNGSWPLLACSSHNALSDFLPLRLLLGLSPAAHTRACPLPSCCAVYSHLNLSSRGSSALFRSPQTPHTHAHPFPHSHDCYTEKPYPPTHRKKKQSINKQIGQSIFEKTCQTFPSFHFLLRGCVFLHGQSPEVTMVKHSLSDIYLFI